MRHRGRGVKIALAAIAITVTWALPAMALVSKSGSINCTPNNLGVTSYAVGHVHHEIPSGTVYSQYNNSTWQSRSDATFYSSSSWRVTSDGSLSDPGTHDYCWGS